MADTLIPAATILLVRDNVSGPEVFMVQRHHRIDFAAEALVFPGGRVDAGDSSGGVLERCSGVETMTPAAQRFRVAAIREAFEESGILLARHKSSGSLLSGEEVVALYDWRKRLESKEAELADFLAEENLVLDCGAVTHYAHWITPKGLPKRFDTHFFIAHSPAGHSGAHDGRESVDSVWIRPEAALADGEAGKRQVIFPTRMNLALLTGFDKCHAIMDAAHQRAVITVEPQIKQDGSRSVIIIPPEAGYPVHEEIFDPAREG